MRMREWLGSFRQLQPATSNEIRRQLIRAGREHDQKVAERDALALDAVNSHSAAERYQRLDDEVRVLERQVQILAAALPVAEEREAVATRKAEALAFTKRIEEFEQATA